MSAEDTDPMLPTSPILRIELGQHTSGITRLDVDRTGEIVVTGSEDKTARVWRFTEGRLLQVLRAPIGADKAGNVYAVAISPDSRVVALGGWNRFGGGDDHSVYLFERDTGRLFRRLSGLESPCLHLAFSQDGACLAAALSLGAGIRIWSTEEDWRELHADRSYAGHCQYIAFDGSGRLATTCYDGKVRLYERDPHVQSFRLRCAADLPSGKRPHGIAFSPNGQQLAVGFDDTPSVTVVSASELSVVFDADTSDIDRDLACVAWSAKRDYLFAAGSFQERDGTYPVLRWDNAGRGERISLRAAGMRSTVMDLKAHGEAGVLFATFDPCFGGFDGEGKPFIARGPEAADMRASVDDGFTVSADGHSVRFLFDERGVYPVRFDLRRRLVSSGAPADDALSQAITAAPGLVVAGLESSRPTLNGKALALEPEEIARSVAIVPDGERFLLGTEWALRLFGRRGNLIWKRPVPGIVWGLNISADAKLALAACGDGTIRWYRLNDDKGEELLALFVHRDNRFWVAWTPQGYFDSAAGADDLIGWHVNRGTDLAAEFLSATQFRDRFYRPDVIARLLTAQGLQQALHEADIEAGRPTTNVADTVILGAELPPFIALLAPHDGATFSSADVILRYYLRDSKARQVQIDVLIDGRPHTVTPRTLQRSAEAEVGEVLICLPTRDITLSLVARDEDSYQQSAVIRLYWRGEAESKPNLYLLAVGVGKFKTPYQPLHYADRDALDFAKEMRRQKGWMYDQVLVRTLSNEEATRDEILDGLEWLMRIPQQRDVAIVFLSGHGLSDSRLQYLFLPYDFELSRPLATGVRQTDLTTSLGAIPAGRVLFFVDSCHAGIAVEPGAKLVKQADINGLANDLRSAKTGVVVFAASTGEQESFEHHDWENGAFTEALLEGLAGRAPDVETSADDKWSDPREITVMQLFLYLDRRVKRLTGQKQTPALALPVATPDFAIAMGPIMERLSIIASAQSEQSR